MGKKKRYPLLSLIFAIVGVGLSLIIPSTTKSEYEALVSEVKDNYYIVSSSFEKMYVHEENHNHEVGDFLHIKGEKSPLSFYHLESEFDFKEYLNKKGVYSELVVEKIEVKFLNPIRIHQIRKNFLSHFDNETRSIVGAILFAQSEESEVSNLSKDLHLVRLFSTSGVYLYLYYFIIGFLLSLFIKKEKVKEIINLILFIPYIFFSFPKFIVLKFFVLKLIRFINNYFLNKRFSYFSLIGISGIFFLIIDYHFAYQDGFLLSYFIPIVSLIINDTFKVRRKIVQKLIVLAFIYLSLIPFTSKYYFEISVLSPFIQLLITPIFGLMFICSVASFLYLPIYSFMGGITSFIGSTLKFFSPIMIKIYVSAPSDIEILLYELLLFSLIYFLSTYHRPIRNILLGISLTVSIIYLVPIKRYIKDYVSFINVGQGDSTLIKYKQYTILIDTGGNKYKDIASKVLIPYLKNRQIYHIDLLITTHDDFDHSGAVTSLIDNFPVKEYVKDYNDFPKSVSDLKITNYNIYPDLWKEENDKSLVLGFKLNNYNYLIMGDAPTKIEKQIIKDNEYIPCDILKVGHHGSKTSTSEELIKYLAPKYGIISCGRNNIYGHPHKDVVAILNKYNVKIRRTDLESTITF